MFYIFIIFMKAEQQQSNFVMSGRSLLLSPTLGHLNKTTRKENASESEARLVSRDETLPTLDRIELVDGPNAHEGRLHVSMDGVWGTVCNRGWTLVAARIACQQLGLIVDPAMHLYTRLPTPGGGEWSARHTEPIWMSELQCDALDTSLADCRHTPRLDHTCTHLEDVWLRCMAPAWSGVRFGLHALPSRLSYASFEHAGQYDHVEARLAAALHFDLLQHELSNLTFAHNRHTSLEIMFNQPFRRSTLRSVHFVENAAAGLLTHTSFVGVESMYARGHARRAALEYEPLMEASELASVRLYASQPRRGSDVRRELTRLPDNQWFIGAEQMVMLYTDVEYAFGPQQLNIQIKTDNNRVLVVDLIDYNPSEAGGEQLAFCEKFCQNSFADPVARQWNLTGAPGNSIYFPLNTSYSVLHISYNVTGLKSGRLAFVVYSTRAPEPVFDYMSKILNKWPLLFGLIKSCYFLN